MSIIQNNIDEATAAVVHKIGNPVSRMVVLATLESFGIREKDVFNDFGFVTLPDLANHIYHDLKSRDRSALKNESELKNYKKQNGTIPVSGYLWMKARLLLQFYPLGIFHLLPIFLQIVSIILFGYSLWTYLGFNEVQSTAVVLGVMLGLIVSGGYVQVLGRQASFYWHHKEYGKAKIVIDKIIQSGIRGMGIIFIIVAIVNLLFNIYPFYLVLITCSYALLIGVLLLTIAPFHTIRQRWVITLSISVATAVALCLKEYTSIHIYFTHWIGIALAIVIAKVFLKYFYKKYNAYADKTLIKPKKLVVIYKNYRYFFYGVLIYVFVFLDRILAWSADSELTKHFALLYEKNYEIGMDLAILIFFMLAGVLEYAIASFSKFMDVRQKHILFKNKKEFNQNLFNMYKGHIALLFLTAIVSTSFIYLVVTQPWGYQANFGEALEWVSIKVCVIGSIGYLFLTWGMLNTLYLFTLDRPKGALTALGYACIVNFVIGYVLCRTVSYEYSVVGMLIGAAVFMMLTLKEVITFFKKLDYNYYAAY